MVGVGGGSESCKIVFLGMYFLFTCSDTFSVRYAYRPTDGQTVRQTILSDHRPTSLKIRKGPRQLYGVKDLRRDYRLEWKLTKE